MVNKLIKGFMIYDTVKTIARRKGKFDLNIQVVRIWESLIKNIKMTPIKIVRIKCTNKNNSE